MEAKTADLCDTHGDALRVLEEPLSDFGGLIAFGGPVHTIRAYEDNSLLRAALAEPGQGRVLVVDGGGSLKRALLGDELAELAVKNDWEGIVIFGCVRDSAALAELEIGIKALGTCPRKTDKSGQGLRDVALRIGGVDIRPGDYLYADEDGVVVSDKRLLEAG
ncbi:ribonuclease E activity regulator RraA [Aquimonas sp.]|jgi:regulator of ribonuclease activity A|uniref:ribonuclease E activity regulator RraA n=1 Tax=Aquimonas sp. TaxID=1872588 RepID=UPI0037C0642D